MKRDSKRKIEKGKREKYEVREIRKEIEKEEATKQEKENEKEKERGGELHETRGIKAKRLYNWTRSHP